MALKARITKLEDAAGREGYWPGPEAFVIFAGKRDPSAIVRAVGLREIEDLTVDVWEGDASPDDAPRMVDELKYDGRAGMTELQRSFVRESGMHFGTGRAWTFHWTDRKLLWVLDQSQPPELWFQPWRSNNGGVTNDIA